MPQLPQPAHRRPPAPRQLTGIIDGHSHAIFPFSPLAPPDQQPEWSVDGALALMDAHGIAATVLSVPFAANQAEGAAAGELARRVNEQLAKIVQQHPTRFGALATVPGRTLDGTMVEMAYALDTLHLDGVATATNLDGTYPGDARFDPWFAEMDRRGTTLFAHPTDAPASCAVDLGIHPSMLEFMFDTTRMLTNLVFTGAKAKFPAINLISTHGGGTLPFLLSRLQTLPQLFGTGEGREPLSPEAIRAGFASFFYDLTAATSAAQLYGLLQLVPAARLLMGFDSPLMPEWAIAPAIAEVANWPGFAEADLPLVAHENAARLFPRLAQRPARPAEARGLPG